MSTEEKRCVGQRKGGTSMQELQLISTRRLDVIDITRKPDKPKRRVELTVAHGAMLGIILAELLLIAALIPV